MVWGLVALEFEALVSGKSRRTGIFTLAAGMVRGREARKKKKKKAHAAGQLPRYVPCVPTGGYLLALELSSGWCYITPRFSVDQSAAGII